jgi:hypothetical protein
MHVTPAAAASPCSFHRSSIEHATAGGAPLLPVSLSSLLLLLLPPLPKFPSIAFSESEDDRKQVVF